MSDKNYIIVEGIPDDLRQEPKVDAVLKFVDRFRLTAEFRTVKANEEMAEYAVATFPDKPKKQRMLLYPYIYVNFTKKKKEFMIKLISEDLEQLRPDECWIDGFYQANLPVGDWISELLFLSRLRSKEIIAIDSNKRLLSVSSEIMGYLYPSDWPLDRWRD